MQSTDPLRPVISNNARPSRFTAAAGTRLAGTFTLNNMSLSYLNKELYNQVSRHHSCNIAGSNVSSLSNIPHCWLKKPGPFFNSSVVDRPLRPTKDHWLGKLSLYQQPNLKQIYFSAIFKFFYPIFV